MTKVNCDLLNETIELMKEQYEEYLEINKKDFEYDEEVIDKLCDCLDDTISELQYKLEEVKKERDRDEYEDYLGDIADEQYEKEKLGL